MHDRRHYIARLVSTHVSFYYAYIYMQVWTQIFNFMHVAHWQLPKTNTSLQLIASIKGGNANVLNQLRYFRKKRQFPLLKTAELR